MLVSGVQQSDSIIHILVSMCAHVRARTCLCVCMCVCVCVCVCAKLLQLCLTLCDPMDCSLPDSMVHGILQVRILK